MDDGLLDKMKDQKEQLLRSHAGGESAQSTDKTGTLGTRRILPTARR